MDDRMTIVEDLGDDSGLECEFCAETGSNVNADAEVVDEEDPSRTTYLLCRTCINEIR